MRFAEPSPIWSRLKEFAGRLENRGGHNRVTEQLWDQNQRYRGRGSASDELSPIVRGARESPSPNRARADGSGRDDGAGARHDGDTDNVSNDWVAAHWQNGHGCRTAWQVEPMHLPRETRAFLAALGRYGDGRLARADLSAPATAAMADPLTPTELPQPAEPAPVPRRATDDNNPQSHGLPGSGCALCWRYRR
jgi:hypothetical protein